ncbi:hypothetical protein [Ancylobacter amanitiformis]|uniref:Uncharacterized protein n=1 Tax=Ancylobacter amanitiformis TaxID=217069 RepID=A0ABU0LPV4_9HYPH|nr:hypothetical protein [Ancylobacter amanitiformis]MDQ0510729.1 hypothetical protein [Ancylobacter amanitiformis]
METFDHLVTRHVAERVRMPARFGGPDSRRITCDRLSITQMATALAPH